jgi:hypothetical protein
MTRLPDHPEYQRTAPALVPRDRRPAGSPSDGDFPVYWSLGRPKRFKARGAIAITDAAMTGFGILFGPRDDWSAAPALARGRRRLGGRGCFPGRSDGSKPGTPETQVRSTSGPSPGQLFPENAPARPQWRPVLARRYWNSAAPRPTGTSAQIPPPAWGGRNNTPVLLRTPC